MGDGGARAGFRLHHESLRAVEGHRNTGGSRRLGRRLPADGDGTPPAGGGDPAHRIVPDLRERGQFTVHLPGVNPSHRTGDPLSGPAAGRPRTLVPRRNDRREHRHASDPLHEKRRRETREETLRRAIGSAHPRRP
ncbi:hypothetical protein Sme01_55840 [Sphaerisporangium melleum]|uniref:Uncharacterized protein n=1 Tax=Sphaerisporangium melleum TaxID=321316 RepID=A0A917RGP9_9ACTN|nr:hypothetical protein GCM10007964_55590 [Sphaerisporangium melleum]GII73108.1 hypothetical protein Sme01_55840 [Sphaerisporangium melleum]